MRRAIRKLFGLKAAAKPALAAKKAPGSASAESRGSPPSIEENSDNSTRRQLVQVVLRDCLRREGVPAGWVECQMLVVNSRSRGPGMYVRLVLRHWDLRLLTYALALQKQLLAAITQFEPQASTWLHGISWEFDVGNTCPYPDMPDPAFWQQPLAADTSAIAGPGGSVAEAGADAEVAQDLKDLQRMFAVRDASIEQEVADGTAPVDFQKTVPSGL